MSGKESGKETSSGKGAPAPATPRVPPPWDGIQVNFCKRPTCPNFGVPPSLKKYARRASAAGLSGTEYRLLGRSEAGIATPVLHCLLCSEYPPIKSNQGIAEELSRLSAFLTPAPGASCPNTECANHGAMLPDKARYARFGVNSQGAQRYRCRACGKTFSVNTRPHARQRDTHKTRQLFQLLMNKVPFKRICELVDISPPTLYRRMAFIRQQCLAFAAAQEQRLRDLPLPRLYLATDRQDYVVNWTQRDDQRNVVLHAAGTADNESSYVFGMHVNFDSSLDTAAVEADAQACGDYELPQPHRRYARLWLKPDYTASVKASHAERQRKKDKAAKEAAAGAPGTDKQVIKGAADEYDAAEARPDVEDSELKGGAERLPSRGMQVHEQYTLYAHFLYLRQLLDGAVGKYRFFLDQDSGMRAACLAAFHREIKARRADAFFVRIRKEITVKERQGCITASRAAFAKRTKELQDQIGGPVRTRDVVLVMLAEAMARAPALGKWKDRWVVHPFPDASEPEKAMCCLTDFQHDPVERYDDAHMANLYLKASLRGVDRFFMLVRRRLSLLERPIATAGRGHRTWYAYSPYQPESAASLLDIFRVFYNFCLTGQDGRTPAMRLGLMGKAVDPQEILYYEPSLSTRKGSGAPRAEAVSEPAEAELEPQ